MFQDIKNHFKGLFRDQIISEDDETLLWQWGHNHMTLKKNEGAEDRCLYTLSSPNAPVGYAMEFVEGDRLLRVMVDKDENDDESAYELQFDCYSHEHGHYMMIVEKDFMDIFVNKEYMIGLLVYFLDYIKNKHEDRIRHLNNPNRFSKVENKIKELKKQKNA